MAGWYNPHVHLTAKQYKPLHQEHTLAQVDAEPRLGDPSQDCYSPLPCLLPDVATYINIINVQLLTLTPRKHLVHNVLKECWRPHIPKLQAGPMI